LRRAEEQGVSATIHYLRPFEREDLAKSEQSPQPAQEGEAAQEPEDESQETEAKPERRRSRRAMPCGRGSKWKKKIGGGVVARDK
jgi:hypothetical protein